MANSDFRYLGSFQKGISLVSEQPLEDIWSRLSLYGSEEYLNEHLTVTKETISKDNYVNYVAVRMRQAVEFRQATRQTTLLTAPLTLYYSFLNLSRACIAIRDEQFSKGHGLRFKEDTQLLTCRAKLEPGTFTDYLNSTGVPWSPGLEISLDDCLSRVIEISEDYYTATSNPPYVAPIHVEAHRSGMMLLHFREEWVGGEAHFLANWKSDFPSLVASCELASGGCVLKVKQASEPNSLEDVTRLCEEMLETNLISSMEPTWFLIRCTNAYLTWFRSAYYLAALFILSSVVRYQPELMLQVTSTNSKWNWLLRRFIDRAERFYPHLMFNWIMNQVYFFK